MKKIGKSKYSKIIFGHYVALNPNFDSSKLLFGSGLVGIRGVFNLKAVDVFLRSAFGISPLYYIYIGYLYHYTYHFIHHAKLLSGPEILILKSINQKSCWLLELVALSSFRFGYIVMSQRYWTFNIKTKTLFWAIRWSGIENRFNLLIS